MAQVFASTSINSATPATDLMTWLDTQMLAAGWTFVEQWVSGAKVANVYKSPTPGNGLAQDFYVAFYRASATTSVFCRIFELYNTGTHLARKYAPASNGALVVDAADGTVTDAAGVLLDSATLAAFSQLNVRTSIATNYIGDFNLDRFSIGSTNYTASCYVGVYDTLLPASMDPVPLVTMQFQGGSSAAAIAGVTTREPGPAPGLSPNNYQVLIPIISTNAFRNYAYAAPAGTGGATTPVDGLLNGASSVYRGVQAAPIFFVTARQFAQPRGVLRGTVTSYSGGAQGDTLAVTMDDGSVRNYVLVNLAAAQTAATFLRTS